MRIASSFGLISTALLMAGCYTERPARTYSYSEYPGGEAVTTTRYNREAADRSLEAGCRQELTRYGELAAVAPNVQIVARAGVVTLNGNVPTERDRQMINACVKNTTGVVSVDDQLRVGYAPTGTYSQNATVYEPQRTTVYQPTPTVAPAPSSSVVVVTEPTQAYERQVQVITATDTDRDLAERIADSIRAAACPPGANLIVQVTDGRAEVRGTVEHGSEKHRLLEAVRHTPGVVEVKDHVHVK